jgi:hypothetical protein
MSEFHDPDLRQELGRLSGPYPDDNAAFAAWQRRLGHARRRRAVGWVTGAALSLVIATVAAAAVQSPGRHSVVPSAEVSDDPSSIVSTTDADKSSTTEATVPDTTAPAMVVPETPPGNEVDTSVPDVQTDVTAAAGDQPTNGSPSKGNSPPAAKPTPTVAASPTKVFHSVGGSITVRQNGTQLTLVSASPAAGFQTDETSHSGDRVQVIFKSGDHQSQITVKLVNGVMQQSLSEDGGGDGHESTVPDSGGDSGHSKGDGKGN